MGSDLVFRITARLSATVLSKGLSRPPSGIRISVMNEDTGPVWFEVVFRLTYCGETHLFYVGRVVSKELYHDAVAVIPVPYNTESTWENPVVMILNMDHEKEEFCFKEERKTLEALLKQPPA